MEVAEITQVIMCRERREDLKRTKNPKEHRHLVDRQEELQKRLRRGQKERRKTSKL